MIVGILKGKLAQIGAGLVVALLLAAGAAVLYYRSAADREARRANENWLRWTNAEARASVTREITSALKGLGDSSRVWQRQVVQQLQKPDSIDRLLESQRKALADLTLQVTSISANLSSVDTVRLTPEGNRSATFSIDSAPYHGSLLVELPSPPARGTIAYNLRLDPANLGLRLACERPDAHQAKRAVATLTTPPWLIVSIDRVEQAPDICNPTIAPPRSPRFAARILRLGINAAAVYGLWRAVKEALRD